MKKVMFLFLMVLAVFTFAACNGVTTQAPTTQAPTTQAPTTQAPTTQAPTTVTSSTEEADTIAPEIFGAGDITVYLDTIFDPMAGVTAIDNKDGDLTDSIIVTGVVDTSKTGTYFLKYSVTDSAGNKREVSRYVTVEVDPSLIGDELIQNGDFSLGNAIWKLSLFEGAAADFSVVDEVGIVNITSPSWGLAAPRLESNLIEFENGVTYEISFKAKADDARVIGVQVGQLLPNAPWFVDFMPFNYQTFEVTTEWQTFTFKITMNLATNANGQVMFNFGTINDDAGTLITKVYLDDVVMIESTPDEDTTAPVISGAVDLTLETGAVYDPLAGVSAYDVVDGEITLDETHYVSDVDTSTPGVYSVTYTVSDAAGNVATVTITVTVVDLVFNNTNDITDGSFKTTTEIIAEIQDTEENGYADITDPEIWYYYVAGWNGAEATFSVIDEAAVIEVTAVGGADWSVMLKQNGIELVTGQTYKLTFTASSTVDRDIIAKVTDNYGQTFALSQDAATYSFIFTYEGEYTDTERVLFMLGNMVNYVPSTITIDDVELGILVQDELVVNGEFTSTGWNVWAQDWDQGNGVPSVTHGIVDGQYVVTTDLLGDANWAIQLFQEGLVLVEGTTYRVTFDAMADTVREINFKLIDGNGAEFVETFVLSETMTTYTFEFLYDGTATTGKLDFELGLIGDSVAGSITFDDILFEEVESEVVVEGTNQVVNGNFEQVVGWSTWAQDWDTVGEVTIEQINGQLVVDVVSISEAFWSVQLFQENVPLVEGAVYTLVFTAKASVERDMSFVLISNVDNRKTFDLTTEFAVYTYTFIYNGTATLGKIDFELGNISEASVPAVITFENIMFYRNFNTFEAPEEPTEEVWVGYGMTVVQTETEITITYADTPTEWWNNNAQGSILPFDGTNESIVFTFTGEAGHMYLFKIEGGGADVQLEVEGTGALQELILDLSGLTESQRDGLNLIIIFCQTPSASGTLVLDGWAYGIVE